VKKRPKISGGGGEPQTILLVEDVSRTAEFYQDVMRFEAKDGDGERYVEFETADGGVLLVVQREGSIAPMASVAAAGAPATLSFAVTAEGYEAWKKWMKKRGIPIDQETKWIHGGRSLYVLDPDGRRIEFKAPADPRFANQPLEKSATAKAEESKPSTPAKPEPKPEPEAKAEPAKAAEAPAKPVEPAPAKPAAPACENRKAEPKKEPAAGKSGARKPTGEAPPINGVVESILYVDDLPRALAFYRDVLGLKSMTGAPGRFEALDAGAGRVLLLFARGSTLEPMTTPGGVIPPHDGEGPHHIALAINADDYDTWRSRLRASGVVIESETHWERGGRSLYFRDPDKHLVELVTPGIWPIY
jgi:catechol 2,3-dioxygenase-like lactoylglutathione lyase family enzyme